MKPSSPAPQVVGTVVELDRRQQAFVRRVPLGEAPRAGGVVVGPGVGQPIVLAVLERIVHQRDEAQIGPPASALGPEIDLG